MMMTMTNEIPPVLNPPPGGNPPSPPPPHRFKRHGCLTAWLALMLFLEATSIITELGLKAIGGTAAFSPITKMATAPGWYVSGVELLALIDIVCVVFLFLWKKWAFFGCVLVGFGVVVLTVVAHQPIAGSLSGIIFPAVLYFVLQIGGENSGWRRLR